MKTKTKKTNENRLANPHPGKLLLKYFLAPRNMTQAQLAKATGLPASRITELTKERRGITVDSAIRLARVLGPRPEFWLGLQADYDMREAYRERGEEYAALKLLPKLAEAA